MSTCRHVDIPIYAPIAMQSRYPERAHRPTKVTACAAHGPPSAVSDGVGQRRCAAAVGVAAPAAQRVAPPPVGALSAHLEPSAREKHLEAVANHNAGTAVMERAGRTNWQRLRRQSCSWRRQQVQKNLIARPGLDRPTRHDLLTAVHASNTFIQRL